MLKAFFDADALGAWWQVAHSVTTPRALGPYAIEWAPTDFRDEVLGRLGGVFRGTVMQFEPGQGFFVADCFWLPPDGDPIGPMALEVRCAPAGPDPAAGTRLHVKQSGFEESQRWRRYYEVVGQRMGARARIAALAAGKVKHVNRRARRRRRAFRYFAALRSLR